MQQSRTSAEWIKSFSTPEWRASNSSTLYHPTCTLCEDSRGARRSYLTT